MADRYWVGGSASWTFSNTAVWSTTSGGAGGASVPTSADNVIFDQAGPYTVTVVNGGTCADLTVSAANVTFSGSSEIVYGSLTIASTTTWSITNTYFYATSVGKTITTNGVTLQGDVTVNGVGGGWQLQSALTCTASFTLTNGSFDLNNFTVTTLALSSSNFNVRSIAFGTGQFTVTGDSTTAALGVVNFGSYSNFTYTGTYKIVSTASGAKNISVSLGFLSEATAPNLSTNLSTGCIFNSGLTGTVSYFAAVNNLDTTGFAGTFILASASTIYGNLTIGSSTVLTSGANGPRFAATSGVKTITTSGKTFDFPVTFNGIGGTWQLQDALTSGSSRTVALDAGTLDLNGFTLTAGIFTTSSSSTRNLTFNSGQITLTGSSATVWDSSSTTGLSYTGTFKVVATYAGSAGTRTFQQGFISAALAQPLSASGSSGFIIGTTSTDIKAIGGSWGGIDLTGLLGTFANAGRGIYGNFNAGTTITLSAGTSATSFSAPSGTWTITTNGRTLDFPLTFNGAGGTWQLQDALTSGSARTATLTAGTLDLNGFTLTTGLFSSSGTTARVIAFGTGNITLIGSGTVWNTGTVTNFSRTGTPTVNVSNNSATATTVTTGTLTEAQALDFNYTVGTYTLTDITAVYRTVNLTGFAGTFTNQARTCYGNFNAGSSVTLAIGGNATTFASTSGVKTITTNGRTLDFPLTFNGIGGTWQLQDALTSGSARTATLTAGTLDLNGFTLTTGLFSSSGTTARVIAFGSGNITVNGSSGTVFSMGTGSNFSRTGTPTVNVANNSASAITVNTAFLTETNALNFNYTTGTYALTDSTSAYQNLNFTGFAGTVNGGAITVYGNFNAGSTATFSSTSNVTFAATSGTKTITSNGRTINRPLAFNGAGGTWQLQDALTSGSTRRSFLQAGTLDLNGFTFTAGQLYSSYSNTRAILFGTGNITITGSGTVWDFSTATGFSRTGTPTVNVSNNSATATTVSFGTFTESQALDFNYTTGTYALTDTSAYYRSLNLTGFAGTFPNSGRTYYGGFNAGSTATMTAGANTQTFSATSGTWAITCNGRTLDFPITFNGVGGTWQLQDNFTLNSSRAFTLTNGTLDINGQTASVNTISLPASTSRAIANGVFTCDWVDHQAGAFAVGSTYNINCTFSYVFTAGTLTINDGATLPVGTFSSSNSNIRTIAFGTGQISLSGNNTTIWNNGTATNFSFTGTFKVVATYTGAAGTRTLNQGFVSEATVQPISTTGSSGFILDTSSTDTKALAGSWGDFDMTGVTGTLSNTARTIYGNFNAGSTVTLAAGAIATTFTATSATRTITTNGRTLDFPITFDGNNGTWQLQGAVTVGSTRTTTLTRGALFLNDFTYTTGLFSSSNSNQRGVDFGVSGTGSITLTGTGTVWNTGTLTNFGRSGLAPTINVSNNSATATTVTTGTPTEAQALDFNYTTGTYVLTDTGAVYRSLNLTGFSGTFANNARTYYGGFNAGSTATMTAGTNAQTFAATSGTWGIRSNGRTLDFPLTFNGVGGTWQLQDALTTGTSRAFTLTSGTFDANNYNVTIGTMSSSNSNSRTLALGSGTWTVAGTGASAWTFATSTNATITGTATISMAGVSAKTFAGGGLTWPTLDQGGVGALTITGNNTFTNITSTCAIVTGACTITLPAGGTQTLTNFTAGGSGSPRLLTLNSSTAGTQTNLVVNNNVNLSFTSLRDNSVSGGYTYRAGYVNGNVNAGNNLGWDFGPIPGSFFSFF